MAKINVGLIKNGKAWEPVIWEVSGKMFFSFNELVSKAPRKALLSCILKVVTVLETKGSTTFNVIDIEASTTANLPKEIFGTDEYKALLGEITNKMKDYVASTQRTPATPSSAPAASSTPSEDTTW